MRALHQSITISPCLHIYIYVNEYDATDDYTAMISKCHEPHELNIPRINVPEPIPPPTTAYLQHPRGNHFSHEWLNVSLNVPEVIAMRHRWSFQGQQIHYHPGIASHRRIHFRKVTVDFLSADDVHVAVVAIARTCFRIHICGCLRFECARQNVFYHYTQYPRPVASHVCLQFPR